MFADFQNCRAIISEDGDAPITLTTVRDMSRLVAQALEYDEVWPTVGGMQGTVTTVSGLIALGEKLRGKDDIIQNLDMVVLKYLLTWYKALSKLKRSLMRLWRLGTLRLPGIPWWNTMEFRRR